MAAPCLRKHRGYEDHPAVHALPEALQAIRQDVVGGADTVYHYTVHADGGLQSGIFIKK